LRSISLDGIQRRRNIERKLRYERIDFSSQKLGVMHKKVLSSSKKVFLGSRVWMELPLNLHNTFKHQRTVEQRSLGIAQEGLVVNVKATQLRLRRFPRYPPQLHVC
jgi:hypothetical protein